MSKCTFLSLWSLEQDSQRRTGQNFSRKLSLTQHFWSKTHCWKMKQVSFVHLSERTLTLLCTSQINVIRKLTTLLSTITTTVSYFKCFAKSIRIWLSSRKMPFFPDFGPRPKTFQTKRKLSCNTSIKLSWPRESGWLNDKKLSPKGHKCKERGLLVPFRWA